MKLVIAAVALVILGVVLAATVNGYGAYVMVGLDLIALFLLAVALGRRLARRSRTV